MKKRKKRHWPGLIAVVILLSFVTALAGCGGGSSSQTGLSPYTGDETEAAGQEEDGAEAARAAGQEENETEAAVQEEDGAEAAVQEEDGAEAAGQEKDGTAVPDLTKYKEGNCVGTLIAEDLQVKVPLYLVDINGDKNRIQAYTDAEDSAAFFAYGAQYVIADHVTQAFASLAEAVPGESRAHVVWADGTAADYLCNRICFGRNEGYLYDDTGRMLSELNDKGITMYTCTDTWQTVTMVFWQPVGQTA